MDAVEESILGWLSSKLPMERLSGLVTPFLCTGFAQIHLMHLPINDLGQMDRSLTLTMMTFHNFFKRLK